MNDHHDWTRLARYLAGECAPEEAEEIRRWIEDDPERRRLFEGLAAAWNAAATPVQQWDTPAAWRRLAARLGTRERRLWPAAVRPGWPGHQSRRGWRVALWAAALLLVAGGGFLVPHLLRSHRQAAVAVAPLREVRVPLGQRAEFRLGDGTRVMLAPGSVLRYDTVSFGVSTRELQLDGRAFFDVIHDPRRPFLVRTARTVTEDLGTEFDISDYAADPATEVVVVSGTVAVRSASADTAHSATVLTRGELVRVDPSGRAVVARGFDLAARVAWTEGRLVFADTPVAEVVRQVNRWYDIDVRLGDARLGTHPFSAVYTNQADSTVVRELASAIGARIERRGRAIVLLPVTRSRPES